MATTSRAQSVRPTSRSTARDPSSATQGVSNVPKPIRSTRRVCIARTPRSNGSASRIAAPIHPRSVSVSSTTRSATPPAARAGAPNTAATAVASPASSSSRPRAASITAGPDSPNRTGGSSARRSLAQASTDAPPKTSPAPIATTGTPEARASTCACNAREREFRGVRLVQPHAAGGHHEHHRGRTLRARARTAMRARGHGSRRPLRAGIARPAPRRAPRGLRSRRARRRCRRRRARRSRTA